MRNARDQLIRPLLVLAVATAVGSELFLPSARHWFGDHQLTTGLLTEAALLAVAYLLIDRYLRQREVHGWQVIALPLIWDLWELAEGLAGSLERLADRVADPDDQARRYHMAEELARTYREVLLGLYPVFTTTPDLAHLLPLAKRVGERARYAAVELNAGFGTGGKLYADFEESYKEFRGEKDALIAQLTARVR